MKKILVCVGLLVFLSGCVSIPTPPNGIRLLVSSGDTIVRVPRLENRFVVLNGTTDAFMICQVMEYSTQARMKPGQECVIRLVHNSSYNSTRVKIVVKFVDRQGKLLAVKTIPVYLDPYRAEYGYFVAGPDYYIRRPASIR